MKVDVITPPRLGGPYYWAENLVSALKHENLTARHIRTNTQIAMSLAVQIPDVYHTTIPFLPLLRKKTVLTIHGDYTAEHPFWKPRYDKVIRKADSITVPSRYLAEKLNIDAEIIPNAIDVSSFPKKDWKEKHETAKCVTMASLYFKDKSAGVLKIMRMLNRIHKNGLSVEYTVIGAGAYLEMLKREAKDMELPVQFTGFVKRPGRLLAQNDLFFYYSEHDNFPLALLEPMACGLPVLTNKVGAVNEIFQSGKDGIIADDDEEYFKSLDKLIRSRKLRMRIGKDAVKKVKAKFDWSEVVKRFTDLYG